ncbi:unnamed protein product, partial [Meganyctiphanes norvegica]
LTVSDTTMYRVRSLGNADADSMYILIIILSTLCDASPHSLLTRQTQSSIDCGSHIIDKGETVQIQSMNYPGLYPRNHECIWDITCSDPQTQIDFSCPVFELQHSIGCYKDYLWISDSQGVLDRYCGAKNLPKGITSARNQLSATFVSNDDSTQKIGFTCQATCVPTYIPTCGSYTMDPQQ